MRAFIAIDLPEEMKAEIFHQLQQVEKKNLFGGKITEKENLHLTIKFFGEITDDKAKEIEKILKEIKFGKFKCEISKTGFFDSESYIRIAWIGLASEKLNELSRKIFGKFSQSENEKDFKPHITLARVNSLKSPKEFIGEIKKIKVKHPEFDVREFLLMKSELAGGSPKYKIIQRFPLN